VHPCPADLVYASFLAVQTVTVTYHGESAHAAGSPDRGINALDAVVAAYNAVSSMRQQFKPTWRAHGIISKVCAAYPKS
jgi:metal-dependent amidase/aminoacylase/carboxypeptidase family protein